MTGEERDDLIDLLPDDLNLWADDEEAATYFTGRTFEHWRDVLGHPQAHPGCCARCGCATACILGAFYEGVVASVVRELDRIGALRTPAPTKGDTP